MAIGDATNAVGNANGSKPLWAELAKNDENNKNPLEKLLKAKPSIWDVKHSEYISAAQTQGAYMQ